MGLPNLYTTDIPARCGDLIETLFDQIASSPNAVRYWGGPLTTTFLLAMATPAIVLPVERIFMPALEGARAVAGEHEIAPALVELVNSALGSGKRFADAPFRGNGVWHFVPAIDWFPVAKHWEDHVLDQLSDAHAAEAANSADAATILMTIRNALAHGAVNYLDGAGRQQGPSAEMYVFVSPGEKIKPRPLRLLRIDEAAFRQFVKDWVSWLRDVHVSDTLSIMGPAFQPESL